MVDALERACAPLRRRSDDLGRACDGFVDKHGAEEIEAAMLSAQGDAKVVGAAPPPCSAGAEVPTGEAPAPAEAPAEKVKMKTKGRKMKGSKEVGEELSSER